MRFFEATTFACDSRDSMVTTDSFSVSLYEKFKFDAPFCSDRKAEQNTQVKLAPCSGFLCPNSFHDLSWM